MAWITLSAVSRDDTMAKARPYLDQDFHITQHLPNGIVLEARGMPLWIHALSTVVAFMTPAGLNRREIVDDKLAQWSGRVLKVTILIKPAEGTTV